MTASVVVNGKTYTDDYTVNVPAGHSVKYVFAKGGEKDEYGQIPNFTQESGWDAATTGTSYHMAVCEKCGTYLSGWEKHEYTEFVQVYDEAKEEYTDKFAATCVCGHKFYSKDDYWLQNALDAAATKGWEVSVVRVMDSDIINWSSSPLKVPENVNLIFEDPLDDLDNLNQLTIEVAKGGHVEGELGDNVIVVDKGADHVDATVTTADALSEAVGNASKDMKVNVTLDDDVTLTSQLTLSDKDSEVNIDLNGNKLTTPSSGQGNYSIVAGKDTKLTVKNGKIEDNNSSETTGVISVQDGTVELENVDIKTSRYGVFVGKTANSATGGKFTMNGGSITTTGQTCCVATNNVATKEGEITLNNVTLKATQDTVVYLPASKVTANINGCTLEGNQGVEIAGGTLNMTNTTIRYSQELQTNTTVRVGGTNERGALLVKLHHSYIEEDEKVNVTLNGVTMTYTGTTQDVKKHVGIYSDTTASNTRSREKNFVGSGYNFENANETMLYGENQ